MARFTADLGRRLPHGGTYDSVHFTPAARCEQAAYIIYSKVLPIIAFIEHVEMSIST